MGYCMSFNFVKNIVLVGPGCTFPHIMSIKHWAKGEKIGNTEDKVQQNPNKEEH